MEPWFLTLEQVLAIHTDQLARYGGMAGVRSQDLLDSAIAQPMATFEGTYLLADIFEMAAAYLFHITNNHPFIDGNKRVGAVAALVFLEINEIELDITSDELEELVMGVANGLLDRDAIAREFRKHRGNP